MRVLLIEDDYAIARSIELILKSQSMELCSTGLGGDALGLCQLHGCELILLDLDLPDMSGFEVLQTLRHSKVTVPVLVLSAFADVESKIRSLGFGADDYMTKPFHNDELLARIHAITRRSRKQQSLIINNGDLSLNLNTQTAAIGATLLHLTRREYQILELLSRRKGMPVSKEACLRNLYGGTDEPGIKIIDVFICKLRKKLARAADGRNYIETVRGHGYTLRDPTGDLKITVPFDDAKNIVIEDAQMENIVDLPAAALTDDYLRAKNQSLSCE